MKSYSLIYVLLVTAVLSGSACNQYTAAPAENATSIPVTATSPIQPTIAATAVPDPMLEGGQWTFVFYHEGLEQVVLVNGGPERGKPGNEPLELWGWNGRQWSLIDAGGPPWRNWPAVAYDPARDVLVVHGGLQNGTHFDETWEWDGQSWTRFTGSGPGAREGALMAYDSTRAKTILFGGSSPDMDIHGDTWEWDGQTWTQLDQTGPAKRFPAGMVYDPARQQILLYSGHFASSTGESIDYDDLWAWDGASWRELRTDGPTPGHRTHAGFVFDPLTKRVLLIGSGSGTFLSDVWAWDGTQWAEVPTSNAPARSGHSVAYDPARDRFVLFGGVERPGGPALDDTWEWDRLVWTCVSNGP